MVMGCAFRTGERSFPLSTASVSAKRLRNCLCLSSSTTRSLGGDTHTESLSGKHGDDGNNKLPDSCFLVEKDWPKNASSSACFLAVGLFNLSDTFRSFEMH